MLNKKKKPKITIMLAKPRGFCAGVTRAIKIVEKAIKKFGKPVYVRHEIVHNRFVVESLKEKGAIFVDELSEVPADRPVIFSAHGVSKAVVKEAEDRNIHFIDATCPLVEKVHLETIKNFNLGNDVILIGHKKHPEIIGTKGQIPEENIIIIEGEDDAKNFSPDTKKTYSYVTQTTLSFDETEKIIKILKNKIPNIGQPNKNDICYATTNRQNAIKEIAAICDTIFVIGSPNSSNSQRLVEVSKTSGCMKSFLIESPDEINWGALEGIQTLGITAGASAPEILVKKVIAGIKKRYNVKIKETTFTKEKTIFKLPIELKEP
ncbi:MAG: 4-hydroxy-3-methylbut-2-enyl diphosphate reductase [Alphaproteobacteria bacterium]